MFRSIQKQLILKSNHLDRQKNKQTIINEVVYSFLVEIIGKNNTSKFNYTTTYKPQEQQLFIETYSKILASELLLRAGELNTLLRQRNVYLKQLIIR